MSPRFTLFIKMAGTCPFSQRAYMVMTLLVPPSQFEVKEIDIQNKPADFLKLNPAGKVPVLIDHNKGDKVVSDSSVIVQYVSDVVSSPGSRDLRCGYQGDAVDCGSGIFPAFAKFMKNKDPNLEESFREDLTSQLKKLEDYLKAHPTRFLLGDQLTEPDCCLLPRLNQARAAGPRLKNFPIPGEFTAVRKFLEEVREEPAWKTTCPTDDNICAGWALHM